MRLFLFLPMCGVDNLFFSCVAWTTLLWRRTKCRCLHRLMKLHLDLLSSRLPRLLPFRYCLAEFPALSGCVGSNKLLDISHTCLSIWYYQDSGGDESSLFIFCRKAAYSRWWFVAPHFGMWASCATRLLFSGRVRQSSLMQGAEHAQVSDLFIS
jgi:hypothetical protein